VDWTAIVDRTARVTVRHDGLEQAVDVIPGPEGRPVEVRFQRWRNANPDRPHRLQPFGGRALSHATHQGFTIPTAMEIGNLYGTPEYAPFFRARLTGVEY
jgi:hypothetical protein